jgi:hypothetical protein
MDVTDDRLLVSIPDAQVRLGRLSCSTIYELVHRGSLTKVVIGRRAFIVAQSIEAFVGELSEAASRSDAEEDAEDPPSAVLPQRD